MLPATSSPALPLSLDGPSTRGVVNDKIQIPAFCGFINRIRFLGFINIAEALQIKTHCHAGNFSRDGVNEYLNAETS